MQSTASGSSISNRHLSAQSRPPSSLSRPGSSASQRPASRVSHRPISRLSQRPATRQSTRLAPLLQALVTQVTGLTAEIPGDEFISAVEYVSRHVEQVTKQAMGIDMSEAKKLLKGHAEKAMIQSNEELANALELSWTRLVNEVSRDTDLDQDIKVAKMPDHLQLLVMLSSPTDRMNLTYAEELLKPLRGPPKLPNQLTWREILAEEPFEGEHWRGAYGLPPGSTIQTWDDDSEDSSPPLSPIGDLGDFEDTMSSTGPSEPPDSGDFDILVTHQSIWTQQRAYSLLHREELEALASRQYWREDWTSVAKRNRHFDIADPSTLGPSLDRSNTEKYVTELDAVREILIGLQGNTNLMLDIRFAGDHKIASVPSQFPRLSHLTPVSQASILSKFAETATCLLYLREFSQSVFSQSGDFEQAVGSQSTPRTLEAFAEAVHFQVQLFERWCAEQENILLSAQIGGGSKLVVSLLVLEKAIRDTFSDTYPVLVQVLRHVQDGHRRLKSSPSAVASIILDRLFEAAQVRDSSGDVVTARALMRVFSHSAEPLWSMVGRWLHNGMPDPNDSYVGTLDDEFFMESNDIDCFDPDFWTDGYVLRSSSTQFDDSNPRVPLFLQPVLSGILSSGKSSGLLRMLGEVDSWAKRSWLSAWPSFTSFMSNHSALDLPNHSTQVQKEPDHDTKAEPPPSATPEIMTSSDLSLVIYDRLMPLCQQFESDLTSVIFSDCGFWVHLRRIEDLYLMRKGDSMSHFCDMIFAKMDSRQNWNDYHVLNSAFRNVASPRDQWIDTTLVRFSHRGYRESNVQRTVKGFDGLSVEYSAPFPLVFIFNPHVMQIYNSVFVFLLQIRRAKAVLDHILVRGSSDRAAQTGDETKIYYGLRSKLSWIVNTLLNFIATNVLHVETHRFHLIVKEAKSLDDMIKLHRTHTSNLEQHCFLNEKTAPIRRAIISILDMSVYFSECLLVYAGDRTLDIQQRSAPSSSKRHRSRRIRRQRQNIVAFSDSYGDVQVPMSESDSEVDEEVLLRVNHEDTSSFEGPSTLESDNFVARSEKMSTELDGLVRFIRRGVESIANGGGKGAQTFETLAFALEDWDR
ncbi:hypothetical protein BD410DRAFT_736245 [Rickenella mellea]|uniref:Spindle pole body component n=1 Tax=Rickenella mellea TaxID=50990 RepID=A0A4R5XG86_9AGAM|nr:hypothetical protein BD410DRAFT_736245 [Rickenella mellea]